MEFAYLERIVEIGGYKAYLPIGGMRITFCKVYVRYDGEKRESIEADGIRICYSAGEDGYFEFQLNDPGVAELLRYLKAHTVNPMAPATGRKNESGDIAFSIGQKVKLVVELDDLSEAIPLGSIGEIISINYSFNHPYEVAFAADAILVGASEIEVVS